LGQLRSRKSGGCRQAPSGITKNITAACNGEVLNLVTLRSILVSEDPSIPDKVTSSFKLLEAAASRLNAVSDDLSAPIAKLDLAFKDLNLGIPAWVEVEGNFDGDSGTYWYRELGYGKVRGKWCVALRTREGDASDPDDEHEERWPFDEGPRSLRLMAIDFLPALMDAMAKQADETSEQIKGKIGRAVEIANAVIAAKEVSTASKPRRK
jgi:hypothetical protein